MGLFGPAYRRALMMIRYLDPNVKGKITEIKRFTPAAWTRAKEEMIAQAA